jgi:hypothetical protein
MEENQALGSAVLSGAGAVLPAALFSGAPVSPL